MIEQVVSGQLPDSMSLYRSKPIPSKPILTVDDWLETERATLAARRESLNGEIFAMAGANSTRQTTAFK